MEKVHKEVLHGLQDRFHQDGVALINAIRCGQLMSLKASSYMAKFVLLVDVDVALFNIYKVQDEELIDEAEEEDDEE
ncbi:hypothetical protein VNO78_24535 [Psophocarpus tetragonolobus]|uniref:Uncharacterized protein n=1 Tax=Psophocarpus tetragonolobus TaxID=3891 RepID=A0AAN9S613_PSOTE